MPRAAQQAFGVVSTALNDITGTPRDPRRPAPTAPPPSRTHPPHSTTVSLADRPPPSPLPSFRSGVTAPLVSHLHRIRDLDAKSTAIVDGVKRKVETRLEATRSGEGDPSSKRTRASGDASSSGASVPSANEREVRDACTDALNVADEKVALAQAAYDLIDAHITKLDRDLRTFDQALLERAVERLQLSARSLHRILRVARTIADLAGSDAITTPHLTEALGYRGMDRGNPA